MTVEIVVPQVGEAVSEVTLVKWLKKEGDAVKKGEVLFEVDTDKAVVEVEAFAEGKLAQILVPANRAVRPRQVVGLIAPSGESGGAGERGSKGAAERGSTPEGIFDGGAPRRASSTGEHPGGHLRRGRGKNITPARQHPGTPAQNTAARQHLCPPARNTPAPRHPCPAGLSQSSPPGWRAGGRFARVKGDGC